jgi:hypothetical protein
MILKEIETILRGEACRFLNVPRYCGATNCQMFVKGKVSVLVLVVWMGIPRERIAPFDFAAFHSISFGGSCSFSNFNTAKS